LEDKTAFAWNGVSGDTLRKATPETLQALHSKEKSMKRTLWLVGLVFAALWILRRWQVNQNDNDLRAHFRETESLGEIGNMATNTGNAALAHYPLTSLGESPLAGIWPDWLNPGNPFQQEAEMRTGQATPNSGLPLLGALDPRLN